VLCSCATSTTTQAAADDAAPRAWASTHSSKLTTPGELDRAIGLGADPIGINARDLSTFHIDRSAQLDLVAHAPRDRVVIAESGIDSRAQAAAAELAGADAVLVGSALMRAADPAAKLRELIDRPLVKICGLTREEDVAVAAEAGADLAGFILAKESPRRADRVLSVPETMLSVAVFVGERSDAGSDLVQLYERENGHRGRDAVSCAATSRSARVLDLPWQSTIPSTTRARGPEGASSSPAGSRRRTSARRSSRAAVGGRRELAARALDPAIKDHDAIRAFVEAVRRERRRLRPVRRALRARDADPGARRADAAWDEVRGRSGFRQELDELLRTTRAGRRRSRSRSASRPASAST
jgi:hypothetical protein